MNKGNTTLTIAIVIAVVILGTAIFWSTQDKKQSTSDTPSTNSQESMDNNDIGITEQDAIADAQRQVRQKTGENNYQGQIIAGTSSPYLSFTKTDYDKALSEGKLVFLDFYANWCPICRAEAPELITGFNALTTNQVVGFRVNYNDDETDSDEKALAEQFNIPYQHTKVIVKNGQEVSRSGESWDKERFLEEINSVL